MRVVIALLFLSLFFTQNIVANDDFSEFSDEYKTKKESFDPLKPYNQMMTYINDKIYINLLNPVAKTYTNSVHESIRNSISNIFSNLLFPVNLVNNLFQFKFQNSLEEIERFVINTTLGIAGINDIAKDNFEIEAHREDFGQTLGYYGITNDIYLVLPILGPSNLRDFSGTFVDFFADPLSYVNYSLGYKGFRGFNEFSYNYKYYEDLKQNAIDFYPLLKDAYEQNRNKKIKE